jgi:DNA-binding transcriptional ArsR family regulator
MAGEEGVKDQIKDLSEKIERLEASLARVVAPYGDLLSYIERFQTISRSYFRLMEMYEKYGAISPELVIPGLKDPMARDIVRVLFDGKERNISQITREVKAVRGTASRRIVREKLAALEERGAVVRRETGRSRVYTISEEVARKWSEVLGFLK